MVVRYQWFADNTRQRQIYTHRFGESCSANFFIAPLCDPTVSIACKQPFHALQCPVDRNPYADQMAMVKIHRPQHMPTTPRAEACTKRLANRHHHL